MIDIKNLTDGPKVVNAQPPFILQAREEREDIVISSAELAAAEATGYFEIDGEADDAAVSGVGGDAINEAVEIAKREIIDQAEAKLREIEAAHTVALNDQIATTEAAEKALAEANAKIDELTKAAAERDASEAKRLSTAGKNKAQLLDLAADEGVKIEDGATNADIASAIELAREEAAKTSA